MYCPNQTLIKKFNALAEMNERKFHDSFEINIIKYNKKKLWNGKTINKLFYQVYAFVLSDLTKRWR